MTFLQAGCEQTQADRLALLVAAPTTARVLYPRGRFEGLEPNMLQVLIAVQLLGEPTVREVEAALAMGHGTVTTALGILQDRRLIIGRDDHADGRIRRQTITAAGREVVARFADESLGRLGTAGTGSGT